MAEEMSESLMQSAQVVDVLCSFDLLNSSLECWCGLQVLCSKVDRSACKLEISNELFLRRRFCFGLSSLGRCRRSSGNTQPYPFEPAGST